MKDIVILIIVFIIIGYAFTHFGEICDSCNKRKKMLKNKVINLIKDKDIYKDKCGDARNIKLAAPPIGKDWVFNEDICQYELKSIDDIIGPQKISV